MSNLNSLLWWPCQRDQGRRLMMQPHHIQWPTHKEGRGEGKRNEGAGGTQALGLIKGIPLKFTWMMFSYIKHLFKSVARAYMSHEESHSQLDTTPKCSQILPREGEVSRASPGSFSEFLHADAHILTCSHSPWTVFTSYVKCHHHSPPSPLPEVVTGTGIRLLGAWWKCIGGVCECVCAHSAECAWGCVLDWVFIGIVLPCCSRTLEMLHGHACSQALFRVGLGPQCKYCPL